jgi:sterol desaturase/sphingolipid hydroxylase (fatty acid hydroxylase superfamily)
MLAGGSVFNLILYAIPVFVTLLALEWVSFRHAAGLEFRGYDPRDTATSLTMGLGNVVINAGWKLAVVAIYAGVYELTPLRIPSDAWWAWVVLFFADDMAFYWYHRVSHEVRLFWASHVVHHSSEHYNFSTALRQPWVPMTAFAFWVPLAAVGFKPWMIVLQQAISLTYQFFLHTERVRRLPRPFEFVLNTPSHHRVHHGSNDIYLDRNYGGILIIWDRLFGSFQAESEPVRYGLTKNIRTHNPLRVAGHEYAAMWSLVRQARSWRDRVGVALRGPAWVPPSLTDPPVAQPSSSRSAGSISA